MHYTGIHVCYGGKTALDSWFIVVVIIRTSADENLRKTDNTNTRLSSKLITYHCCASNFLKIGYFYSTLAEINENDALDVNEDDFFLDECSSDEGDYDPADNNARYAFWTIWIPLHKVFYSSCFHKVSMIHLAHTG